MKPKLSMRGMLMSVMITVGRLAFEDLAAMDAVLGLQDAEAHGLQRQAQHVPHRSAVVDGKDSLRVHWNVSVGSNKAVVAPRRAAVLRSCSEADTMANPARSTV